MVRQLMNDMGLVSIRQDAKNIITTMLDDTKIISTKNLIQLRPTKYG